MRPKLKTSSRFSSFIVVGVALLMMAGLSYSIPKPVPDDKGTDFIFTTPLCTEGQPLSIFIIPQTTMPVNISLVTIDNTWHSQTVDSALRMSVPCSNFTWNNVSTGVFYLFSSAEVSLILEYTDDSHMVFPIDTLGTTHIVSTIKEGEETFLAIAGNASYVEINLPDSLSSTVTFNGISYLPGSTINLTLSDFEYAAIKCNCDLTGVIVTSSLPVNVLAGGTSRSVATIEQLPPRSIWGKKFIFSSHPWMSSVIRLQILGQKPGSGVKLIQKDQILTSVFDATNILPFNITVGDFFAIEAESPVLCAILFDINDRNNIGHRTFSFLVPLLLYHVNAYYLEDKQMWSIDTEVSAGLVLTAQNFPFIYFNDSLDNDPFTKPMTYFWKLFTCKNVPLISPYKLSTDNKSRIPFLGYVFKRDNLTAFHYYLGMRITSIYDACVYSPRSHGGNGDGVDNDCDNRIDEESLNNIDDDGDGRVDEDISYHGHIAPNPADLAYIFYRDNKEVETGISTSVVSVIVSIVVALCAVGGFIGIMILVDRLRQKFGSTRVTPLNDT